MLRSSRLRKKGEPILRILLLEVSAADAELVRQELDRAGLKAITERLDTPDAFTRALEDFAPDVVLADHRLAQFDAAAALQVVRAVRPIVPLIVVVEAFDAHIAAASLRAGVEDIVLKSNLTSLRPVIEAALAVRQPLGKLSPRQLEVLRLVSEGQTTREIARWLRISVKTVETHRAEVMKRLDIHDVAGLVRYAVRVGLVR
jgi:DNA-binding NarL/FixJ family response regulator